MIHQESLSYKRSEGVTSFLAIDLGNSRLKATWLGEDYSGQPVAEVRSVEPEDADILLDWIESLKEAGPLAGAFASVGQVDARLVESLRRIFDGRLLIVTQSTTLPILVDYATPDTLGLDRKATACAAAALFPGEGVLVVDSGSALTVDIVTAEGKFIGGNISPGLGMRLKSLHNFTAHLPLIVSEDAVSEYESDWGNDTRSAIIAGCARGILDEVAMGILRTQYILNRVIVTGGGGKFLAYNLPDALAMMELDQIEIDYIPHLLAEGLREIYMHHENEI